MITIAILLLLTLSTHNGFSDSERFYFESSYACDKFFNVTAGRHLKTNEQVASTVERIHIYCPDELIKKDTIGLSAINATFPQLKKWDWNNDFIHSYPTKNGRTAYVYIKKLPTP